MPDGLTRDVYDDEDDEDDEEDQKNSIYCNASFMMWSRLMPAHDVKVRKMRLLCHPWLRAYSESHRPLAEQVLNVNRRRKHDTVSPYSQKEKKNNVL
ncbi:hypothetical protein ANN_12886 [Periplaneta americana]|uniref:Uncharacterized protein n=1 Tax=Periplaneta americana TaxID=6978 RepID=A0ABQ8TKD5_PERAM|nr:hypothetical protein ANN_12886 [Periplaneta americana]